MNRTPVADPGEGLGGPGLPPYFSTKLRPEGPKNIFSETGAPSYVKVWINGHPPYLKVWVHH